LANLTISSQKLINILQGISQKRKKLNEQLTPLKLLIGWFITSAVLSAVILLKFYFIGISWIVTLDIILYLVVYFVFPIIFFYGLVPFFSSPNEQFKTQIWRSIGLIVLFFVFFIFWICATVFRIIPDYITCTLPLSLLIIAYYKNSQSKRKHKRQTVAMLIVIFAVLLVLPYFTAYQGYSVLIDSAKSSDNQPAYISQSTMQLTGNIYLLQNLVRGNFMSRNDLSKFLMSGAGECGETAMLEQDNFKKLGFDTMEVSFPGEDHAFVEVKINSTWQVIDPGYSMTLVSREYRSSARINETGTISYVTGNSNGSFVELTQDYVSTDTIALRVTNGNTPVKDASVNLVHQLRYGSSSYAVAVPGDNFSFHTDSNGTIIIHLGKICEGAYSPEFAKTDPFFQIYVNGQQTNYRVNSTGTGLNTFVGVDL
jgi:hypothetical protein